MTTSAHAISQPVSRAAVPRVQRRCWQALWAVLLLAHLPGLVSAALALGGDGADWLRVFAFAITNALFLLKLADVPWLRVPESARARIGLIVAVAVLHAGAIERSARSLEISDETPFDVVVAGGVLAAVLTTFRPRINRTSTPRTRPQRRSERSEVTAQTERTRLLPPPLLIRFLRIALPDRAPPMSALA